MPEEKQRLRITLAGTHHDIDEFINGYNIVLGDDNQIEKVSGHIPSAVANGIYHINCEWDNPTPPLTCKHCEGPIYSYQANGETFHLHSDGLQQGRHNCPTEPYGFHAEPVGAECSTFHANMCAGARGFEVKNVVCR